MLRPVSERAVLGVLLGLLAAPLQGSAAEAASVSGADAVYDDALENGFADWSWADHDLAATSPVHSGTKSIRFHPAGWDGLFFHSQPLDAGSFSGISLWVYGGASGGQVVMLRFFAGQTLVAQTLLAGALGSPIAANTRKNIWVSFSALGMTSGTFDSIYVQDWSGVDQGDLYLDDIQLLAAPGLPAAGPDVVAYDDALENGFQDWSWADHDLAASSPVHTGARSIRFHPAGWDGLYFHGGPLPASIFSAFELWVNGGATGGQKVNLRFFSGQTLLADRMLDAALGAPIAAGGWQRIRVSFMSLGLTSGTFDSIYLQDWTGGDQPDLFVDDITLVGWPAAASLEDGNPCTTDGYDPASGVVHAPLALGASCSDGDVCNGEEFCDGVGTCSPGVPLPIDDGNACTVDTCDPVLGVLRTAAPAGTSCSDGNVCNGLETCDGAASCRPGMPSVVDDGDPCTIDSCDPVLGVTHAPVAGCGTAPTLVVSSPPQGFVVTSPLVLVRGSASGGVPPLTVTVNGVAAPLAIDGTFSTMADAAVGPASVTVLVVDSTGTSVQSVVTGQRTNSHSGDGGSGTPTPGTTPGTAFTYDAIGNLTAVINTVSDVNNCGTVGTTCRGTPHGPAACLNGVCVVMGNGQPVDVSSDPTNCGDVGYICPGIDHGTASCSRSTCGIDCVEEYAPAGGRCVDLATDPGNCGSAGNVCLGTDEAGPVCVAGVCKTTGVPVVYSVNGIPPPGQQFKAPFWAGIHVVGENLQNVTYIELEDWSPDTVDGDPDGAESLPSLTGNVLTNYPSPVSVCSIRSGYCYDVVLPLRFMATPTSLDIPAQALWGSGDYPIVLLREWYKLRLHYTTGDIDNSLLVEGAISFDEWAPVTLPPPEITSISTFRELEITGDYNPATGFIPTRQDLTTFHPAPTSVLMWDPLYTEYPILSIEHDGVYVAAGIRTPILINQPERATAAVFVFPYDASTGERIRLSSNVFRLYEGVIVRGSGLHGDGGVILSNPVGTEVPSCHRIRSFLGDRAVLGDFQPDCTTEPSAYVEYASERGTAVTSSRLNWIGHPVMTRIGSEPVDDSGCFGGGWPAWYTPISVAYGQTVIVEGEWLDEVRSVGLNWSQHSFQVIDRRHLRVNLSSESRTCEQYLDPVKSVFEMVNFVGRDATCVRVSNRLPPCPTWQPGDPPPDMSPLEPFDLPPLAPPGSGGDCSNTICFPQ